MALTRRTLLQTINDKLDLVLAALGRLEQEETRMAADLTALTQAVADEKTVVAGAVTLMDQLTALLQQAKNDPAQIQAIIDQVTAQKQALADALVRNTPTP